MRGRGGGKNDGGFTAEEQEQEQDCFNSHCNISSRGQDKVCTQCNLVVRCRRQDKKAKRPTQNPACQFQPTKYGKAVHEGKPSPPPPPISLQKTPGHDMMPHPALLSPHSLFGGREKGKRKGKKVQRRHPPRSHPIRGKAPPQNSSKKNSGANAPKLAKEVQKSSSSFPHQKKPGCTRPPLPPYPSNRPPRPTPIGTPSQAPLLGLGLAQSLVVRGLPHSGVSAGRSRAKKKVDDSPLMPWCREVARGLRAAIPCASGDRLRFLGSVVGEAAPVRRRGARGPEKGSAVVLLLWGAEPWGCLERPELGLLFPREPPRECRALSAGCGAGEKRGRNLRWPGPRACTRSACPSRQRGPCLTRRRRSASPSPGRQAAARSGSQTGP